MIHVLGPPSVKLEKTSENLRKMILPCNFLLDLRIFESHEYL